ncbi:hypothetical protein CHUAL_012246 [Chamberlinius hualienensis]
MSCMRCGVEFGIFKKESYCRHCGYSFCSGCLTNKVVVPKIDSTSKHAVCNNCFGLLSGKKECNANKQLTQHSPPAALVKRMEALNSRQNMNSPMNNLVNQKSSDADRAITQRLQNLRVSEPAPSLAHLEERLARLRGSNMEKTSIGSNEIIHKIDKRTNMEKTQDLLNQVTEQIHIDSKLLKPEDDIRLRLARLRGEDISLNDLNKPSNSVNKPFATGIQASFPETLGQPLSDPEVLEVWKYMMEAEREACREAEQALCLQEKDLELKKKLEEIKANCDTSIRKSGISTNSGDVSDDDNEDKISNKIVHQFLSEATIDQRTNYRDEKKRLNSAIEDSDELEELPWCTICNNDASLRCYGCDGDLYCRRCFKECHDTFELRDHPSATYCPKQCT